MLPYFKRYSIYVSIMAIALPVVVSTVWPLFTGQMMATSVGGLVALFALFVLGLFSGYAVFGRKADAETERLLAAYNDRCDPQALVDEGAKLANSIPFPCDQSGSWYLGYYAQALLDLGRTEQAQAIQKGISDSAAAAKKPAAKAGILSNLLPLVEKTEGPQAAIAVADEGMDACGQLADAGAAQMRDYFESQRKVLQAELSDDASDIAKVASAIAGNDRYPRRIRVEYAWRQASAEFKLGDKEAERKCLRYVADNGGKLALAAKAKERLAAM